MTTKTRAIKAGVSLTRAGVVRLAGASVSCGQMRANSRPAPRASSPGMAKAARQPNHCTMKPVLSAATAMAELPARP